MCISNKTYKDLSEVYKYFNDNLFDSDLPEVILTLHRKAKARGYCWYDKWQERHGEKKVCEVALNPDTFKDRNDIDILSTLVHEMAHVWQFAYGTPSRGGYHNKEWAEKMKEIGLYPSNTGEVGGKETGPSCSHYIIGAGRFDKLAREYIDDGFKFDWQSLPKQAKDKKKDKSKVKYTCPDCELNAWAKAGIEIKCGYCEVTLVSEE